MTTTDRPVSDERAAEIADMVDHRHSGLGAYWGLPMQLSAMREMVRQFLTDRAWGNAEMARLGCEVVVEQRCADGMERVAKQGVDENCIQAAQIAALVAERDALRAKLGTVLLCANCGAAAVAAIAEQEKP